MHKMTRVNSGDAREGVFIFPVVVLGFDQWVNSPFIFVNTKRFFFLQFSVNGRRMEANKFLLIFETLKKFTDTYFYS